MTAAAHHERTLAEVGFDLHDGPLQDVAYVLGQMRALRDDIAQDRPHEEIVAAAEGLESVLVELERGLRGLATSLASPEPDEPPFRTALADAVSRFERRSGLSVELALGGPLDELPAAQRHALLAVASEALENARKHSRAGRVQVDARASAAGASLEVRDDGVGVGRPGGGGRLGLRGMAERVRRCGGTLEIGPEPTGGTHVRALLPPG